MENYQNLIIYYFSGTGNARNAAQWMINTAKERKLNTHLISIDRFENVEIPEVTGKSLIGFCSSTHGFNLPPLMLEFINKFPKNTTDADVFILNTRGGMKMYKLFLPGLSGVAQYLPAIILKLKGYRVVGMQPMDMPSNWIALHPGIRKKVLESIHKRCKQISVSAINKLLDGKTIYKAFLSLPFDLAIAPVSLVYYFIGRFMLAKTFVATNACTKCRLCMKQCPVGAIIEIDNRMYWKFTCESCMRCMNQCPERAIETNYASTALSGWLIIILFGFIFNFLVTNQFIALQKSVWLEVTFNWIIISVFMLGISFLMYKLFHILKRFKAFDFLITYTSLTKFKFWRRYKAFKNF